MPTAARGSRRIHFSCTGDGPGVVLVPGLGSGARLFGTLPRRLARAGFTCAAVDPVGLPPSSELSGPFDFAAAAADLLAVAAALPSPVALVGTSLGGKVALQAAASAVPGTVHRLVLLCSTATVTPRSLAVYRYFELLASEVDGRWLGELTAPFLFGDTFHRERPAVVADILRATRPSAAARAFMLAQARALPGYDGETMARACQVPCLCLAGTEDALALPSDVARTAAMLPAGTYREIPGAGHSLLLESAAAFDDVVAFLRD
jgi:pimeloyl-ACP methyl ester carboxylesterase